MREGFSLPLKNLPYLRTVNNPRDRLWSNPPNQGGLEAPSDWPRINKKRPQPRAPDIQSRVLGFLKGEAETVNALAGLVFQGS